MLMENTSAKKNPQMIITEPNNVYVVSTSDSNAGGQIPKPLIVLLIFVCLQLALSIAVLVIKVVMGYIGFNQTAKIIIDTSTCTPYEIFRYSIAQLHIMEISLVMVSLCVLLTIILLIVVVRAIVQARKLPTVSFPNTISSFNLPTLYRVLPHQTIAFCYILQSLSVLSAAVVFGYYLSYFIGIPKLSCTIVDYNSTQILVIWIVSAALLAFAIATWIIIVILNFKFNRESNYLEQDQLKNKTYNTVNNTQITQYNNENYNDPLITKNQISHKQQKQYQPQKTPSKPMDNNNYNIYVSPQPKPKAAETKPIETKLMQKSNQNQLPYKSSTQNNIYTPPPAHSGPTSNNQYKYENPVFKSKRQLYDSPYKRIQKSKYYEGDKDIVFQNQRERNNKQIKMEMVAIQDKQKQAKRSRFNTGPSEYKPQNLPEDQQFFRAMTRQQVQKQTQQRGFFRASPARKILPEATNYSSPKGLVFEGGNKTRLHGTYFTDQTSMMNKRRYQNSDEKKKRRGILNEYIRGKYVDG